MKYLILYVCIILLTFSLYHDLQKDKADIINLPSYALEEKPRYYVKKRFVTGDTALTLIENVNGNIMNEMPIDDILNEFKEINNLTDHNQLKLNTLYRVPIFEYEKRAGSNQP